MGAVLHDSFRIAVQNRNYCFNSHDRLWVILPSSGIAWLFFVVVTLGYGQNADITEECSAEHINSGACPKDQFTILPWWFFAGFVGRIAIIITLNIVLTFHYSLRTLVDALHVLYVYEKMPLLGALQSGKEMFRFRLLQSGFQPQKTIWTCALYEVSHVHILPNDNTEVHNRNL